MLSTRYFNSRILILRIFFPNIIGLCIASLLNLMIGFISDRARNITDVRTYESMNKKFNQLSEINPKVFS